MPEIRPFRGLLYDPEKISLQDVVAPPYDVISSAQQDALYRRSPQNVVRLILNKERPDDDETGNRYTRAQAHLQDWLGAGFLREDEDENIYVYEQEFAYRGRVFLRRGLIAAVRVEDFEAGEILPHEKTFAKAKEDRLRLLRACRTNFSQVFALYQDPDNEIEDLIRRRPKRPVAGMADDEGVINRLFAIPAKEASPIREAFSDRRLYIADGHHRYETALRYRNEMRKAHPEAGPDAPWEFAMMMLVSADSPGLLVLPTHRVVGGIEPPHPEKSAAQLSEYFEMRPLSSNLDDLGLLFESGNGDHLFGAYMRDNAWLLRVRDLSGVESLAEPGHTKTWRRLDVSVLHTLMPEILPRSEDRHIKYVVDPLEAKALVDSGDYQAAFFLRPTPVRSVLTIAEERECMPEKSTYFYPKLLSGLVMRKLS